MGRCSIASFLLPAPQVGDRWVDGGMMGDGTNREQTVTGSRSGSGAIPATSGSGSARDRLLVAAVVAVVALAVAVVVLASFVVILARDAGLGAGPEVGGGAGNVHTVVYGETPAGVEFVPRRLVVAAGDRVVFVNDSRASFWPASNIHPTHEVLPAFDPLRAIPPGGSWGYTFTEVGEWRYHDHLEPDRGGVITVIPAGRAAAPGPVSLEPSPGGAPVGSSPAQAADLADEQSPPQTEAPTGSTTAAVAGLEPLSLQLPDAPFPAVPEDLGGLDGIGSDDAQLREFVTIYGPAAAVEALRRIIGGDSECHQRAHEVGRVAFGVFGRAAFVLGSHGLPVGVPPRHYRGFVR